ncbi:MAG TPA: DNA polymerase III subunit alpha [Pseudolabrys sp.]|jgi:error-prone DNA polymerase|nr:DNA polymerase III subunit alpha [Pseudolabrys sp.]
MRQQPPHLEFAVASNFSFLRGASHPEELMLQAQHVGLTGLGLCDRNSVAGVVRAHLAKREQNLSLRYHPGARLVFSDGTPDILAYPRDRAAWGRLTRLLTIGNLRAKKGECILTLDDLIAHAFGLELVVLPSPRLRGEGDEHRRREPDEGAFRQAQNRENAPSPAPPSLALRRVDLSPHAGRGDGARASEIHHVLSMLRTIAPNRVRLAASMLYRGRDRARLARLKETARDAGVPLIAINDVHFHHPDRRRLADVLTCIREKTTIDRAGRKLAANAERFLKPPQEMLRLFRDAPEAIEETLALSDALTFSLDELRYEYPDETIAGFDNAQDALTHLAYEGAARRYPGGIPGKVRDSIAHELKLIAQLDYAPYFLTVHDIVHYARSQGILCQGRGSAANSAVCYCLGVTEVDPVRADLLFERFISPERREPPDIDVDFEHERREEVIQYIYGKYGRERAGIAATVISYRGRSAIREVGKAFGLSEDTIGALSSSIWGGGGGAVSQDAVKRTGLDPQSPRMRQVAALAAEIDGFPRHLSQHVGGFVITRSRLDEVMPIGNGAMADRTFVEWDKDDLDALGILKIDVLGLGMLTCLRKALDLVGEHYGLSGTSPRVRGEVDPPERSDGGSGEGASPQLESIDRPPHPARAFGTRHPLPASGERERLDLSSIPAEEKPVYDMLGRADSLGVFQVESRAQMTMLPRLKPKNFYDLVIEVAIVRPGPIQGDMVHPYLRRRQGLEPVSYPSKELEAVLSKTLGVPLFQEQAMKIAIVAAGFTPAEADKLRRAMATFKRTGTIGTFQRKMIDGMLANGYARDFAERCFGQIEGFGEYGFPESHAASFALLVYASAWLKCRYPDAFGAALLNAQPMGFYAPSQIVRDAREHGVEVRPPDVNHSDWDSTLERAAWEPGRLNAMHSAMREDIRSTHAIRLGLREIKGLSEEDAKVIVALRRHPEVRGDAVAEPRRVMAPPSFEGGLRPPPQDDGNRPYDSVRDVWLRTGLSPRVLERLADADAFNSLGLSRRDALWAAKALGRVGDRDDDLPLFGVTSPRKRGEVDPPERSAGGSGEGVPSQPEPIDRPPHPARSFAARHPLPASGEREEAREPEVRLPPMPIGEEVVNDYRFLRLSLRAHPAQFLRADLARRGILRNEALRTVASGTRVRISGLVTCRQRPGSAKGVVFMTIEDESAVANAIVWPKVFERARPIVLGARYIAVSGRVQSESGVIHVVADELEDLTALLAQLAEHGADIDGLARCDEVRRPIEETREARAQGGRESRLLKLMREMPELAADLDVTARGSAHTPTRRSG